MISNNNPNVFRKGNRYFYQSSPSSEEVPLTPIDTSSDNPVYWTFLDSKGNIYTPKELLSNLKEPTWWDKFIDKLDNNEFNNILYKIIELSGNSNYRTLGGSFIRSKNGPFTNGLYGISSKIMELGRGVKSDIPTGDYGEPSGSVALATYLMPRHSLDKIFKQYGYTRADGDYGLVRKAVGNRDIPVYQRNPDAIKREELTLVGNPMSSMWFGDPSKALVHAGSYPTALYHDKDGKLYQKAWDLNDYGGDTGAAKDYSVSRKLAANLLDVVGSPVVVTTGFLPAIKDDGSLATLTDLGTLDANVTYPYLKEIVDKYLNSKGLKRYDPQIASYQELQRGVPVVTEGFIGLPEVTVTGRRKSNKYKKYGK